jgi:protein involved in polysaccharide export with SLBB domain
MKHRALVNTFMSLLLGAAVCAGEDGPPRAPSGAQPTGQQPGPPSLQHRNPRYKITPSDSFDLTFPLCPEFNQIGGSGQGVGGVVVQPDGYISLSGVGDIYVAGMTLPRANRSDQSRLFEGSA